MILRGRLWVFLLVLSIFAMGCNGSKINTIREVAHKYLAFRLNGDFESARGYVTQTSQELLNELEEFSEEYELDQEDELNYLIVRVDDQGSSATVYYSLEGYGEEKLLMTREQGNWKVVLNQLSFPDAGLLMMELHGLEMEDSSDIDKEALDALLMQEGLEDEFVDITEI
ncbi:MAG: hypothetical protein AAF587_27585 [Bacteroidota bacterium]